MKRSAASGSADAARGAMDETQKKPIAGSKVTSGGQPPERNA